MSTEFRALKRYAVPQQFALLILAALTWYPFLFLLATSVKSPNQFFENYWWFTFPFDWPNYAQVWPKVSVAILNSAQYSLGTLVIVLILSLLGGYTFGRMKFPCKNAAFLCVVALLMIPGVLTLVPLFVEVKALKLLGTPWALILPFAGFEIVIGIYIMRLFFERLPGELFQAARIEGANEVQLLLFVALPLALPGLGTVAILDLLFTWNELLWPLITVGDATKMPVAVAALGFKGEHQVDYGALFAAYVSVSIPLMVIFVAVVRKFIKGIEGI
ncbi:MAG: sugar transporter, permease protein [Devosia sp.]|uniref:carbohydrate ABC transporter permease n=1 Tax=Devosia sp. TaxID=1871048 RepID=UPI002609B2F7|nr:carbohydrate ABC transporter permease [Devosia sp.]MDB5538008.1 sugar transporter, permease protein [Devosia sp.]MDB5585317.1 sugar transporter, permease protein [Devosia sp.]